MKKKLLTFAAAGVIAAAMSFTAFGGEWKEDQIGWWYQNDDGSYLNNGWNWIGGKSYYFTPEGYCLVNTTTPDGYTVDESGAWVVDGVIQTQGGQAAELGETHTIAGLSFMAPAGFSKDKEISDAGSLYFFNDSHSCGIALLSEEIPEAELYGELLDQYGEAILDMAMNEIGVPAAKETKQFSTGTWYCYQYNGTASLNIPAGDDIAGPVYFYTRITDTSIQMVMFVGNTGVNPDDIMKDNVR